MDTYDAIETDQYSIELSKIIWKICHLQDDYKQDVMATVKNDKQVYLVYQSSYQSKAEYLVSFKPHLKLSEEHSGAVVHHQVLSVVALQ